MTALHDGAEHVGVHAVIVLITDNLPKQVNGSVIAPVRVDTFSMRACVDQDHEQCPFPLADEKSSAATSTAIPRVNELKQP